MKTEIPSAAFTALQAEQTRLRAWLAALLLLAICAFALFLSWLAQDGPLQPLLSVKVSLIALLTVYAVGVGVAWIYARWIRLRREPAVRVLISSDKN